MRFLLGSVDIKIPLKENVGIRVEVEARDRGKLDPFGPIQPKTRRASNEALDPAAGKFVGFFSIRLEGASMTGHAKS